MKQWHPLFAKLLRPLVEDHYQMETNMPVGDIPRAADIVLLRRTSRRSPPFQGLWKNLTIWNVVEFKGRTVSARVADLDLLVELGLGIQRRLNEERVKQKRTPRRPEETSFWYIANRLGHRFLRDCREVLGPLEALGAGVWRGRVLRRPVILVSSAELPVDEDSLVLHLLSEEPPEAELAAARFLVEQPELWQLYGPWWPYLHPGTWTEVEAMAKEAGWDPKIDLAPLLDFIDLEQAIELAGLDRVIEHFGKKTLLKKMSIDDLLENLSPAERRELKRRLQ
jgi:hypothetical protein